MDVPLPPLLPGLFPTTNSMLRGSGILYWLSPKAGLINCSKPVHATVSFQLKDFCDSGITDLTQFLRVGFRLAFHAIPNNTSEWIANYVSPISEQDLASGVTNDDQELNIESFESNNNIPTGKNGKDTYSLDKEMRALSFLLGIFQKCGQHYIPLSNLHSRISNSGDQELSRYIGSSSLKRRQFIEDRSYIFMLADNDVVYLQAPEVYQTVTLLADFLLKHGGVTSSDMLFNFFNKCLTIPISVKESIQNRRPYFMQFLTRHPFAFAPFPSQYFVGVRRNLPFFEYGAFIRRLTSNSTSSSTNDKKINGIITNSNFSSFNSRPVSRPLIQSSNENFDIVQQQQPLIDGITSSLNGLGIGNNNPISIGGLTNGYTSSISSTLSNGGIDNNSNNLLGRGGSFSSTIQRHHNNIGGIIGNNNNNVGSGSSSNSLAAAIGSVVTQSNFLQRNNSNIITTPSTTQKPLFSLFDDPILSNPTITAPISSNLLQNGNEVRAIIGNNVGSNNTSNNVATTSNIWTYDIDFFDRSKISEVFSNDFNNLSIGKEQQQQSHISPPINTTTTTRKQFVEKEIQTDESLFTSSSVCSKCAQKMCK